MESVVCNNCRLPLDGIAYKTQCKHLLCPLCARKGFEIDNVCPVCNVELRAGDLHEISINMAQIDLRDFLYQTLLQDASWKNVLNNSTNIMKMAEEIIEFTNFQLFEEINTYFDERASFTAHMQLKEREEITLRQQIDDIRANYDQVASQLEDTSRLKHKEIAELQEQCKEKQRKCQAWEKAYNNIRNQLAKAEKQLNETNTPRALLYNVVDEQTISNSSALEDNYSFSTDLKLKSVPQSVYNPIQQMRKTEVFTSRSDVQKSNNVQIPLVDNRPFNIQQPNYQSIIQQQLNTQRNNSSKSVINSASIDMKHSGNQVNSKYSITNTSMQMTYPTRHSNERSNADNVTNRNSVHSSVVSQKLQTSARSVNINPPTISLVPPNMIDGPRASSYSRAPFDHQFNMQGLSPQMLDERKRKTEPPVHKTVLSSLEKTNRNFFD